MYLINIIRINTDTNWVNSHTTKNLQPKVLLL